jgi:hypothetical protein
MDLGTLSLVSLIGLGGGSQKSKTQGIFGFQKKYLKDKLLPQLGKEYNAPDPAYRTTAESGIQASLKGLENASANPEGLGKTGQLTRDRLNQLLSGGEQYADYFRQTVQNPMLEAYQQEIIPATKIGFLDDLSGSQRNLAVNTEHNRLIDALTREKARTETEGLFAAIEAARGGAANVEGRGYAENLAASESAVQMLEDIRERRRQALLQATLGGGGFSKSKGYNFNVGVLGTSGG